MFEKLKEYGLYIILGLIALGALAYAYVQTSNSQKGAEIESANFDALIASQSKSDKLKKSSTVADDLLSANGGKTIGKYRVDSNKVSYVIGETYSDIFDNKKMIDISSDLSDIEEGQLRTILIAQPAISVNGDDTINTVNLNSDKSLTVGSNTISQENLDKVADELKGYNVGAIGFATFATEQEAKDFRDTYFSSYEVYEIGNTGNFVVLKEYNQGGESTSIQGKIATQSNLDGTGGTGGSDTCNEYLCLDTNGITIKALNGTTCGNEYEFQGNTYYVACNKSDVQTKIFNEGYQANRIVTSKLTDMSSLFQGVDVRNDPMNFDDCVDILEGNRELMPRNDCDTIFNSFNQDIGNWDVSNVTNMSQMFYGNINFNQSLNHWNTGNVTNMNKMFAFAMNFNSEIGNWNTGNVTNMSQMFLSWRGSNFNQNIGNWNVSNVTDMTQMFRGAHNFNNGGSNSINTWNTGNVTSMDEMFSSCSNFNQPIGNWDMSNVTNIRWMFSRATSFNQDIGSWNTSNITNMKETFVGAPIVQDLSHWDVSNVTDHTGFDAATSSAWTSDMKPHFN